MLPFKSNSTQTAVSFSGKTSLTGCFVPARFIPTGILVRDKKKGIPYYSFSYSGRLGPGSRSFFDFSVQFPKTMVKDIHVGRYMVMKTKLKKT